MVRWAAASLALASLCTPAIGLNNRKTCRTAQELPEHMNLNTMGLAKLTDLNSIQNITDFAKLYRIELPPTEHHDADAGTNARQEGGSSFPAEMANCAPELRTVKLDLPKDDVHTGFYPTCVRLERCGGCCPISLLTCRPIKTETVMIKVMKYKRTPPKTGRNSNSNTTPSRYTGKFIYTEATRHVECDCNCTVKEEDCDLAIHHYSYRDCGCVCKDQAKKEECLKQNDIKRWINNTCTCECWHQEECGTGDHFDQDTCKCEKDSEPASHSGLP